MFFSIIIPTYNRAHLITETIQSVQNQTFEDWECIVVDDGSKDNTKEIVEKLIEDDARIRYLYQENAERSAARNNGIEHALGEYICFLDSDDYYLENHLEVLKFNILLFGKPKGLFFVNCLILNNKKRLEFSTLQYNYSVEYFIQNSIIPARVCIHKNILKKIKFDKRIVIVEDSVLWTKISINYPVFHIKDSTVVYRWHEDNSINIKNNCYLDRLKGLRILFKDKELVKLYPNKKRKVAISNCYYGIAKHYLYKRKFLKMIQNILISLFLDLKCKQNKAKIYMIYEYFR